MPRVTMDNGMARNQAATRLPTPASSTPRGSRSPLAGSTCIPGGTDWLGWYWGQDGRGLPGGGGSPGGGAWGRVPSGGGGPGTPGPPGGLPQLPASAIWCGPPWGLLPVTLPANTSLAAPSQLGGAAGRGPAARSVSCHPGGRLAPSCPRLLEPVPPAPALAAWPLAGPWGPGGSLSCYEVLYPALATDRQLAGQRTADQGKEPLKANRRGWAEDRSGAGGLQR